MQVRVPAHDPPQAPVDMSIHEQSIDAEAGTAQLRQRWMRAKHLISHDKGTGVALETEAVLLHQIEGIKEGTLAIPMGRR